LKVHVILGQFSVLNVLLSLLSLTFVLGSDIKKFKGSITIRISCILTRYYGKRRGGFKERWYQRKRNK